MPLGAEGEGLRVTHRYRFDDAVGRCRLDGEALGQPLDALAVDGVHHRLALAEDLLEETAGADVDGVCWRIAHVDVVVLGCPVIEAALMKDLGTQLEQDIPAWIADELAANDAVVADDELLRTLSYVTQIAPSYSLRGGTREILRSMIARGLGLR